MATITEMLAWPTCQWCGYHTDKPHDLEECISKVAEHFDEALENFFDAEHSAEKLVEAFPDDPRVEKLRERLAEAHE